MVIMLRKITGGDVLERLTQEGEYQHGKRQVSARHRGRARSVAPPTSRAKSAREMGHPARTTIPRCARDDNGNSDDNDEG